jgi:hypothetical protein
MYLRNVISAALVIATVAFAQTTNPAVVTDAPYQVRYAANLGHGESYIDITNDGANGASLFGSGFGAATGNICANVYAFDPNEEMISCCSCLITPDSTASLGVNADMLTPTGTLTGVIPTSVTIKLVATLAGTGGSGSSCTQSAATLTTLTIPTSGMAAWGTTLHLAAGAAGYATTETPFTPATLGAAEEASLANRCTFFYGTGSGSGICSSCHHSALGASALGQ